MLRRLAACLCALALTPAVAHAATTTVSQPVYDAKGHLIQTPFVPAPAHKNLDEARATALFLRNGKVADWLSRYPKKGRVTDATFKNGVWTVKVWWGKAGEIAEGSVEDSTTQVTEAWTGPQVAWKMARGYDGAFGGKKINEPWLWLTFSALFLIGLAELRRPLTMRNLDLLALLFFSVSLWYFNHGEIFTAMPLAYLPMGYLLARGLWIGVRGRASPGRSIWPVWLLLAATIFLAGFRVGLNIENSNVIDVGLAGVVGADRIAHGEMPYGHMPLEGNLKKCGPADSAGEVRERIQTNGRCETAIERGDTYGPVAYEAYLPAYLVKGWSGKWDKLPTAHWTSILWDLLCLVGMWLLGRRLGGSRTAATLAFAWAAYPFTQYVSNSNTNDSIMPAFLIFGLWLASNPWSRGAGVALAGWTKFAALLVAPLWLSYPEWTRPRAKAAFLGGFALATLAAFSIVFLEPNPLHAVRVFVDRTIIWQSSRDSPFSIWDWRQYHARGLPDLHLVQRVLQVVLVVGAVVVAFVPRRKSMLQLVALTGVLMVGFELVLTHWFYLYLPWFFPFVAAAALAPGPPTPELVPEPETHGHEIGKLVPAR
ncbi:MAG: hypothetical protein QOE36_638 [Gaiellaceae bacterium]|jgi:hypothetical protein|nr:hypothetical protein [Gaiellaceae bacterium]